MTLPFISTRAGHMNEARLWASRLPTYNKADKKRAQKAVIEHLLAAIGTKK